MTTKGRGDDVRAATAGSVKDPGAEPTGGEGARTGRRSLAGRVRSSDSARCAPLGRRPKESGAERGRAGQGGAGRGRAGRGGSCVLLAGLYPLAQSLRKYTTAFLEDCVLEVFSVQHLKSGTAVQGLSFFFF